MTEAVTPPPAGGDQPWYQGKITDQETIGALQTKGWHNKPAADVALEAFKAYREIEKFRGMPADEIVRLPKDTTAPEWAALYKRLGKPDDAAGYDLSQVKTKDGKDIDPNFGSVVREVANRLNMPGPHAAEIAKSVIKFIEDSDAKEATDRTATLQAQRAELARNWGVKPEAINQSPHFLLAQAALKNLGWDAQIVNALEKEVGYAGIMNKLADLGKRLGEDRFISGGQNGPGPGGLMTKEQAVARRAELSRDSAWVTKYNAGDAEARKEMWQLTQIITGISANR